MNEITKGCETCRFFLRQDYGYSNYTTEGAYGSCLKSLNPHMPLDLDAYGEDAGKSERALAFGEGCGARIEGEGPWFDVDGEVTNDTYKDKPDIYALLLAHDEAEQRKAKLESDDN